MPFHQLCYTEQTKSWSKSHYISMKNRKFSIKKTTFSLDGLVEYIKNNVPTYANAAYPSVMKSIDIKLKQFMETLLLKEGEKVQFCKVHDTEGIASAYGKVYYAERRDDRIHLMATMKKGQKAGTSFSLL